MYFGAHCLIFFIYRSTVAVVAWRVTDGVSDMLCGVFVCRYTVFGGDTGARANNASMKRPSGVGYHGEPPTLGGPSVKPCTVAFVQCHRCTDNDNRVEWFLCVGLVWVTDSAKRTLSAPRSTELTYAVRQYPHSRVLLCH